MKYAASDTSTAALKYRAKLPLAERVEAVRAAVPPVTDEQAERLAHLLTTKARQGRASERHGLEI